MVSSVTSAPEVKPVQTAKAAAPAEKPATPPPPAAKADTPPAKSGIDNPMIGAQIQSDLTKSAILSQQSAKITSVPADGKSIDSVGSASKGGTDKPVTGFRAVNVDQVRTTAGKFDDDKDGNLNTDEATKAADSLTDEKDADEKTIFQKIAKGLQGKDTTIDTDGNGLFSFKTSNEKTDELTGLAGKGGSATAISEDDFTKPADKPGDQPTVTADQLAGKADDKSDTADLKDLLSQLIQAMQNQQANNGGGNGNAGNNGNNGNNGNGGGNAGGGNIANLGGGGGGGTIAAAADNAGNDAGANNNNEGITGLLTQILAALNAKDAGVGDPAKAVATAPQVPTGIEDLLKQFDKNQDGQIDADEAMTFSDAIKKIGNDDLTKFADKLVASTKGKTDLDTDGDGKVSEAELKAGQTPDAAKTTDPTKPADPAKTETAAATKPEDSPPAATDIKEGTTKTDDKPSDQTASDKAAPAATSTPTATASAPADTPAATATPAAPTAAAPATPATPATATPAAPVTTPALPAPVKK